LLGVAAPHERVPGAHRHRAGQPERGRTPRLDVAGHRAASHQTPHITDAATAAPITRRNTMQHTHVTIKRAAVVAALLAALFAAAPTHASHHAGEYDGTPHAGEYDGTPHAISTGIT